MHHSVRRLEDALSRMDRYSTAGAEQLLASERKFRFVRDFARAVDVRPHLPAARGFLDGREGFLLAVANAEGTYYRYMKAWIKGRKGPNR